MQCRVLALVSQVGICTGQRAIMREVDASAGKRVCLQAVIPAFPSRSVLAIFKFFCRLACIKAVLPLLSVWLCAQRHLHAGVETALKQASYPGEPVSLGSAFFCSRR